jgi:hypothetical protein
VHWHYSEYQIDKAAGNTVEEQWNGLSYNEEASQEAGRKVKSDADTVVALALIEPHAKKAPLGKPLSAEPELPEVGELTEGKK